MKRKIDKFKLFKILCLIAYIGCIIVLIVESAMDGKSSANQSNTVGGGIADIINGIGGDKTVAVTPTSLTIDNKDEIKVSYVGDTVVLLTTTLPEDATYKEVLYSTSDSSVANISDDGKVTFLKEGNVTITVTNNKYNEITDSVEIEVLNVEATDIFAEILNAEKDDEDIYTLYVDDANDYQIVGNVLPENATFNHIHFEVLDNKYLSLDDQGKFINLKDSKGEITTILVSCHCGDITKEIKVIVDIKDKIDLEDILFTVSKNEIYATESLKLNIKFIPTDATYKNYTITSSNPKIVSVTKTTIKGLKEGSATITIKSDDYNIEKTIEITVLKQPNITSFTAKLTNKMTEKETKTISISNILPNKYALKSSLIYTSSDTSLATVNSSGKVTAKKAGNVVITVTTKDGTYKQELPITVSKYITPTGEENHITGFIDKTFETLVVNEKTIDLAKYFNVASSEWIYDDSGKTTGDKTLKYILDDETYNVINGSTLTINQPGEITLVMQHIASGQSEAIKIIALNSFDIVDKDNNQIEQISLNAKQEFKFIINDSNTEYPQLFDIKLFDENNNIVKDDPIIVNNNDGSYTFKSIYNEGKYTLVVTPILNETLYDDFSKTIEFNIKHTTLNSVNFDIVDKDNNVIHIENDELEIYINDKYSLVNLIDNTATKYNLIYLSSDENIAYVNEYNELVINNIGEVDITLKDEESNNTKKVHLKIYNKILINKETPITIKGTDVSYNANSNTYYITNGYSSKLTVNFLEGTTFKKLTLSSSNEKILSVGKDGTLTPHKKGNVTITIICDDNMQEKQEIKINIEVKQQPVIKDLSEFFYKVRKGLGHFGAFLVLGIFSTFTYMLFFTKKKWFFSVPLNFIVGFFIAALTEYIQTLVPGRYGCWSDIVIDYSGFSSSAVVLTVIIFVVYFVKFLKNRKTIKE